MTQTTKTKQYDLEERTFNFAKDCRNFVNKIPRTKPNEKYSDQLIRSSGSVAGNYIEANESLSRKDFIHRIKICKKEVKESRLWLRLIEVNTTGLVNEKNILIEEATELMKIFGSIIKNSE